MLNDGYWKQELRKELKILKRIAKDKCIRRRKNDHKFNKSLLYSAIVIRKLFEDEKYVKSIMRTEEQKEHLELLKYEIVIREYKLKPDEKFITHRAIPEHYDFGQVTKVKLNDVCNQIIHSFIWTVIHDEDLRTCCGVLFASDKIKKKALYYLELDDWIKTVEFCVDNSKIIEKKKNLSVC